MSGPERQLCQRGQSTDEADDMDETSIQITDNEKADKQKSEYQPADSVKSQPEENKEKETKVVSKMEMEGETTISATTNEFTKILKKTGWMTKMSLLSLPRGVTGLGHRVPSSTRQKGKAP